MRSPAILMALLVVPTVLAWDDAGDDVQVGMEAASVDGDAHIVWLPDNAAGWYPHADLLSASITETQDDVTFQLTVADAQPSGSEPAHHFVKGYRFDFTLRGQPMSAFFQSFGSGDMVFFGIGELVISDFSFFYRTTYGSITSWSGNTLQATVEKGAFRDFDYVPLRKGDVIKDVSVRFFHDEFGSGGVVPTFPACPEVTTEPPGAFPWLCTWHVHDTMEDLGDVAIELAPTGVGHLLMRADRPWRLSNGLATTYLFEVDVHNFDAVSDTVQLQAVKVPPGWEVLHPTTLSFDGKDVRTIPVAVTVPFIHSHGDTRFFELQGVSQRDADIRVGTPLGVIFAEPAQPGGHHNTLYFHAHDTQFSSAWMNTLQGIQSGEGDRARGWNEADPTMVGPFGIGGLPTEAQEWTWDIRLNPFLQMGLDFDLAKPVVADLDFEFPAAFEGDATAVLWLSGTQERPPLEIATMDAGHVSFPAGAATPVRFEGAVLPAADRVPYGSGNLYLTVTIAGDPEIASQASFGQPPLLVTDSSSLRLPLFDYHDEVDLEGLFLNAFQIGGNRTFAHVNPGKTAAFVFNVTNLLSDKDTLSWSLTGANAAWAKVIPGQTVVAGGGSSKVVVAITAPAGAEPGDTAEVLLRGVSKVDPERQVFVRMTAVVDDRDDIPDESYLAQQQAKGVEKVNKELSKDSPAFEVVAVLAALVAALLMLRRRA